MPLSRVSKNKAVKSTCTHIEKLLKGNHAFQKVEEGLYVIKQGSSLVMISVHPWKETHVVIRLVSQLVKGVDMETRLALDLLELNAVLRFGAFSYIPKGRIIAFSHTLLERALNDEEEFMDTIRDFAIVADEYDDRIAARYGGSTMLDLLEEQALEHMQRPYDDLAVLR